MLRIVRIPELGLGQLGFLGHQVLVLVIIHKGHTSPDAGFPVHEPPREEAHLHPSVQQQVQVTAQAFGVDDPVGEHLDVHQLVLVIGEDFLQLLAVLLAEVLAGLVGLARHPVADDRVQSKSRPIAVLPTDPAAPGS